ncbi:MAG: hypothetical protein ABSE90_01075 [Verrucomicrobiota bacterium]|jgi:hypothetical protein
MRVDENLITCRNRIAAAHDEIGVGDTEQVVADVGIQFGKAGGCEPFILAALADELAAILTQIP